jgi:5-methyltetrahydropteroyltriglutamate--homocysteine methyltransferase
MGSALLWGGVAASSLVIGALLGLARRWPDRWVGVVLAFGAGALVSSVSFELAEEGLKVGTGGDRLREPDAQGGGHGGPRHDARVRRRRRAVRGFVRGSAAESMPPILPTSLVGSYPQPDWLIDRAKLASRFPPRVRALELWRVDPRYLEEAQDDATRLAIRDQERAGLDIVTDGEQRRESYSNRFANALTGIDLDNPGTALDRSGHPNPVPRVVGPIQRKHPVQVGDLEFLRASTDRKVKITVPGPFTMSQQAQNEHYEHDAELGQAYAAAVNEEIADLFRAGADLVQIDEPYMQARPEKAREYGLAALERALDGHTGTTAVHICFGYAAIIHERPSGYSFLTELAGVACDQISIETAQSGLDCSVLEGLPGKTIILGVIDLDDVTVETPETVAERIRRALPYKGVGELVAAPDCGMKYLPRDAAFGKLQSLVEGARMVRDLTA